jgi:hypothetical protein
VTFQSRGKTIWVASKLLIMKKFTHDWSLEVIMSGSLFMHFGHNDVPIGISFSAKLGLIGFPPYFFPKVIEQMPF